MAGEIRMRSDTTVGWATKDPVLARGEPGYDSDTGEFAIGNGVSSWSLLSKVNSDLYVESTDVTNIVQATQAEYDALTPDAKTLYIIIG